MAGGGDIVEFEGEVDDCERGSFYEFAGVGRQPRGRPASASGTRLEPERGSVPHAAENEAPREWGSRCSGSIEPDELGLPETPAARAPAALGNKGARLTL